jgi:hypothetical protein
VPDFSRRRERFAQSVKSLPTLADGQKEHGQVRGTRSNRQSNDSPQ